MWFKKKKTLFKPRLLEFSYSHIKYGLSLCIHRMRVNITQCDLQGQKKTWVFCFALVEHFLRGKSGSYKKSYFPKPATWRECLKKEMPGQPHLSLLSSGTRHVNKEAILDIPAPVVWCIEESRNPFDSHNQVSRSIHLSPSVKWVPWFL